MHDDGTVAKLRRIWQRNLEAPEGEYDEELADEVLGEIEKRSPKAFRQIKDENHFDELMGNKPGEE